MEIKIGKADRLVTLDIAKLLEKSPAPGIEYDPQMIAAIIEGSPILHYVFRYGGTQCLNDACSSVTKEKPAEAWALATKKLAALQSGEVRTRRDGGDDIEREAIRLALIRVKASATFKGKSSKEQSEAARKYAPQFRDQAKKNLDELPELSLD